MLRGAAIAPHRVKTGLWILRGPGSWNDSRRHTGCEFCTPGTKSTDWSVHLVPMASVYSVSSYARHRPFWPTCMGICRRIDTDKCPLVGPCMYRITLGLSDRRIFFCNCIRLHAPRFSEKCRAGAMGTGFVPDVPRLFDCTVCAT